MKFPMTPKNNRGSNPSSMIAPWKALAELEAQMERLIEGGPGGELAFPEPGEFAPACDLRETAKEYVARFDIPGLKKEEIKIEVEDDTLTVRGDRRNHCEQSDGKYYISECASGSFVRSITLPSRVIAEKVGARYDDGVLTVTLPKTEISHAKSVKVN